MWPSKNFLSPRQCYQLADHCSRANLSPEEKKLHCSLVNWLFLQKQVKIMLNNCLLEERMEKVLVTALHSQFQFRWIRVLQCVGQQLWWEEMSFDRFQLSLKTRKFDQQSPPHTTTGCLKKWQKQKKILTDIPKFVLVIIPGRSDLHPRGGWSGTISRLTTIFLWI